MAGEYNERNIFDGVDADGLYPANPLNVSGRRVLAFYGDFGGATVTAKFSTETPAGTLEPLPDSANWTFTSAEAPEIFVFPVEMPVQFEVSGATATTSIGLNMHPVVD